MRRPCLGYTLFELVLALAGAALLFGFALPAFSGGIEAARAGDARSALLASLVTASHRAALTGSRAVLCPSLDGQACAGTSPDWTPGWIVFLDRDGNRERASDESLLHHQPALDGGVRLRSTAGRTRIVFQGNGGNAGSNVSFTLCDGRGPAQARGLVLNNRGRLRDAVPLAEAVAATCAP